jgi:hypothetical protein
MAETTANKRTSRTERRAYWQAHVQGWRDSGQSKQAYCRDHGLKAANLYRWCAKLGDGQRKGPRLVPVQLPMLAGNGYAMELALSGGRVLRVGADVDPHWVSQLVRELEREC